jgi:hypothetical protein
MYASGVLCAYPQGKVFAILSMTCVGLPRDFVVLALLRTPPKTFAKASRINRNITGAPSRAVSNEARALCIPKNSNEIVTNVGSYAQ